MKFIFPFVDNSRSGSVASRLRRKRFVIVRSIIDTLDRPAKVLDVGGTLKFWEAMGYLPPDGVTLVILNLAAPPPARPNIKTVAGDARNLGCYRDNEFDLVVSNSVIEHIGGYPDQIKMAREIVRVGRRFIVQTPNRSFPLEPHFLVPFFYRLPRKVQIFLLTHFSLGWYRRFPDSVSAGAKIDSIHLLSKKELKNLFDGATLYRERVFGFTKSFMVIDIKSGNDLIHTGVITRKDLCR
jgi:SAM-dependent methyltransferase